jgi:hypothetical protein
MAARMKLRIEPVSAFHARGYADTVDIRPADHRDIAVPYLFHALVIPTGDGGCFMYGLDSQLTRPQFTALTDELRALHFTGAAWHQNGVVRRVEL